MEGEDKGIVCVTGGTGYLASWLIKKLLEDGYRVRTTVRSYPDSKKDLSYLTSLPGAQQNLQIFSADLAHPESFDKAIQGCTGVFHVAHPIDFEDKEPEQVKTQRSINGTLGILNACLNSNTVKRVVYTSSASTVVFNDKGLGVLDESEWSDVGFIRSLNLFGASYMISKTQTEQAALGFAEEHGLDLVTVVPTFINGPFVCPRLPGSVYTSMAMFFGDKNQYKYLSKVQMVHVDDVARAHIFLFGHPGAKGRYNCTSVNITIDKMSEFLSTRYPEYPIPTPDSLKEIESFRYPDISSKKLLDTGFKYKYGLEEIYDEAIQCCKEKGFL
ncbi:Vestitone reductase [Actinidia chinensis var. chinensis]|uniref:Dihydroflavonol 4-reductase n=1 Tax=Actinidia chinensis var. chinensis TaxID=1590841 RepID=A0A2R6R9D7_ACTCC|nr:Vestitone reductase [Actinidia chinensis var. chinensis]